MKLDEILFAAGKYPDRKRLGRGTGSGHGKTSGRGTKGAGARAGVHGLGEGGQNAVLARMPKRGFSNFAFRKDYQIVNLSDLDRFEPGSRVDAAALAQAGLIGDPTKPVKLLANGQISKKLTVAVNKASASAAQKISEAGGSLEQV